jgi:hypothetical protein
MNPGATTAALYMRCWRGVVWLHHQQALLEHVSAYTQLSIRTEKVASGCRQMEPS